MDKPQRAVMLALLLGAIAYVAYRRLFKPLAASISDDALALEVERLNPQLNQSVISALQFSRMDDLEKRGYSPAMVRQTVQRGATASADLNFGEILDDREFRQNAFLLLFATGILTAVAVGSFMHPMLTIWANRNLLLGDMVWPQQTYLKIERADNGKVVFPPRRRLDAGCFRHGRQRARSRKRLHRFPPSARSQHANHEEEGKRFAAQSPGRIRSDLRQCHRAV
jgi:hypothetical protein